jgi:hypothetical protein
MEVTGEGCKTLGYATTDPKVVVRNEITMDEYLDVDDEGERNWVEALKNEILDMPESDVNDSSDISDYDSDSSWNSFQSSDLLDGEKGWQ